MSFISRLFHRRNDPASQAQTTPAPQRGWAEQKLTTPEAPLGSAETRVGHSLQDVLEQATAGREGKWSEFKLSEDGAPNPRKTFFSGEKGNEYEVKHELG